MASERARTLNTIVVPTNFFGGAPSWFSACIEARGLSKKAEDKRVRQSVVSVCVFLSLTSTTGITSTAPQRNASSVFARWWWDSFFLRSASSKSGIESSRIIIVEMQMRRARRSTWRECPSAESNCECECECIAAADMRRGQAPSGGHVRDGDQQTSRAEWLLPRLLWSLLLLLSATRWM